MSNEKTGDLYNSFIKAYRSRYQNKAASVVEKDGQNLWKEIKKNRQTINETIRRLNAEAGQIKAKSSLDFIWSKPKRAREQSSESETETDPDDETVNIDTNPLRIVTASTGLESQEDLKEEIVFITKKQFPSNDDVNRKKTLLKEKEDLEKQLNRLKSLKESQQRYREKQRNVIMKQTRRRDIQPGRPTIEMEFPGLQEAIISCVLKGTKASVDPRRQTEKLELCKTLDELQAQLEKNYDITIKRSTLYTRLLPKRESTFEGKRHRSTVPVKLKKPENDLMKSHIDGHFAMASIKFIKEFASIMGPNAVFFLSQDDKCRVPIGLPAAQKQDQLLMHLQYKIKLPDHDFMVAEKHKLIPSVYAACVIDENGPTYSGPTLIRIRSGKHDKSTASSHLSDVIRLCELEQFDIAKSSDGEAKPIWLITVDGGPDESPRYSKTLAAWSLFFMKKNIDLLVVGTHAPGQSAYNIVERRMAPLSRDLSGLILPYDYFGSHLDKNGKTTDKSLEIANFGQAGGILASIWSESVIDKFPVVAEYVTPVELEMIGHPKEDWISKHVRQSQYLLQIAKCENPRCCRPRKTNYTFLLPSRFLPPPLKFSCGEKGQLLEISKIENLDSKHHFGSLMTRQALLPLEIVEGSTLLSKSFPNHPMPFDFHCPSVQKELVSRVCAKCGQYFPSKIALKKHIKAEICPVTTPSPFFEYEKGCPTEEDVEEELDIILELEQEDLANALDNFPFFDMEDEDAYNALFELAND